MRLRLHQAKVHMKQKCFFLLCSLAFLTLKAAEQQNLFERLSFVNPRTAVRPLVPADEAAAITLNEASEKWVDILGDTNYEGKPPFETELLDQHTALSSTMNLLELKGDRRISSLYFGIFENETKNLIGIIKIKSLNQVQSEVFLDSSSKYHPDYQGQGLGTEVKIALFQHYQALGIIPYDQYDLRSVLFPGFEGTVVFDNKPSLKYNIKCGYRVGILFGSVFELYYPYVPLKKKNIDRVELETDPNLHDKIIPYLNSYLSKIQLESEAGEQELRKKAIVSIMRLDEPQVSLALEDEDAFIAESIGRFPNIFEYLRENFDNRIALLQQSVESYIPKYKEFIRKLAETDPEKASSSMVQRYLQELEAARALFSKSCV